MKILGISAFYHDSATALIEDGRILAAVQEERFTRIKNDRSFPVNSLNYCLESTRTHLEQVDCVVFYEKPFLKFERIIETYLKNVPRGADSFTWSLNKWVNETLFFKTNLKKYLGSDYKTFKSRLAFTDHHLSHAALAFFTSGFDDSAILTMDGVGEWATTTIQSGSGNRIQKLYQQNYPHSLGLFYSAFTNYLGFNVNSGEYKVMGLAPYGSKHSLAFKRYLKVIKDQLMRVNEDGAIALNEKFFPFSRSLKMYDEERWEGILGLKRRDHDSEILQEHCDLALAVQQIAEDVIISAAKFARRVTGQSYLSLGGGVALNCVANGKLRELEIFKDIHVPFAPGDSGSSIGSALAINYLKYGITRDVASEKLFVPYVGPKYSDEELRSALNKNRINYLEYNECEIAEIAAKEIEAGKVVGWFQGSTEFGPRALGNRSILADPRKGFMKDHINSKVKGRETFRPFAPAVLEEYCQDIFPTARQSPWMQYVAEITPKRRTMETLEWENLPFVEKFSRGVSDLPAITHADFSSRVQTVSKFTNFRFWLLIDEFRKLTGCPLVLNTSFNYADEPIVNSPQEAIACFLKGEMDILVMHTIFVKKDGVH